ncbi:MAG: pantoate--beta-alanine ligase [Rubrobacter sp.]|nr:pantoate--beta-alanine ligase [Rubrobacter sp.]
MGGEPRVLYDIGQMRGFRPGGPVGFVPTLGYLHEGHLSLLRRAREECRVVVLSIFLNPLQFGPEEDLDLYPRDPERDLRLAREAGVDAVFVPDASEMYPEGFSTEVRVRGLEDLLEGRSRPGHFAGVATVLARLLNIVGPDRMYMGQKDAQQAVLVRRMMADLGFPARLVICPTVREEDGLAMSSRNAYLDEEERAAAAAIPRALFAARDAARRAERETGGFDAGALRALVERELRGEPLVELEYVSADEAGSLGPVGPETREVLLSCAARVGKTRLIDNVVVERLRPGAGGERKDGP